jgi:hypothetical protein
MDRELARTSLHRFVACLNESFRDRFFVIDGTLLGLVRSGDFIDGDYDIDFGMWIDDYDDRLIDDLRVAGFSLLRSFGSRENGLVLHFGDDDVVFDMLFFYRSASTAWTAAYDVGEQIRGRHLQFDLERATFHGIEVQVPSPPERYLETVYGRKWRVPVAKWDYRFAPKNLRAHGRLRWRMKYAIKKVLWRLIYHDIFVKTAVPSDPALKP